MSMQSTTLDVDVAADGPSGPLEQEQSSSTDATQQLSVKQAKAAAKHKGRRQMDDE